MWMFPVLIPYFKIQTYHHVLNLLRSRCSLTLKMLLSRECRNVERETGKAKRTAHTIIIIGLSFLYICSRAYGWIFVVKQIVISLPFNDLDVWIVIICNSHVIKGHRIMSQVLSMRVVYHNGAFAKEKKIIIRWWILFFFFLKNLYSFNFHFHLVIETLEQI